MKKIQQKFLIGCGAVISVLLMLSACGLSHFILILQAPLLIYLIPSSFFWLKHLILQVKTVENVVCLWTARHTYQCSHAVEVDTYIYLEVHKYMMKQCVTTCASIVLFSDKNHALMFANEDLSNMLLCCGR